VCANLPPRFLKDYRQACPICLATKRRRHNLPKSADNKAALTLLKPWEVTHFSSGPWRVPSSRGNRYYSLFVCGKRGAKMLVPHRKKTGAQQAYVIGSHPKTLYTDFGGEICSNELDHFLLDLLMAFSMSLCPRVNIMLMDRRKRALVTSIG
jgi:hypothetical protein